MRWCQGEVVEVYENCKQPKVRVLWDACPDIEGSEKEKEGDQVLLPTFFNKNINKAWRMDIDINVFGDESSADSMNKEIESESDDEESSYGTGSELSIFSSDDEE